MKEELVLWTKCESILNQFWCESISKRILCIFEKDKNRLQKSAVIFKEGTKSAVIFKEKDQNLLNTTLNSTSQKIFKKNSKIGPHSQQQNEKKTHENNIRLNENYSFGDTWKFLVSAAKFEEIVLSTFHDRLAWIVQANGNLLHAKWNEKHWKLIGKSTGIFNQQQQQQQQLQRQRIIKYWNWLNCLKYYALIHKHPTQPTTTTTTQYRNEGSIWLLVSIRVRSVFTCTGNTTTGHSTLPTHKPWQ